MSLQTDISKLLSLLGCDVLDLSANEPEDFGRLYAEHTQQIIAKVLEVVEGAELTDEEVRLLGYDFCKSCDIPEDEQDCHKCTKIRTAIVMKQAIIKAIKEEL